MIATSVPRSMKKNRAERAGRPGPTGIVGALMDRSVCTHGRRRGASMAAVGAPRFGLTPRPTGWEEGDMDRKTLVAAVLVVGAFGAEPARAAGTPAAQCAAGEAKAAAKRIWNDVGCQRLALLHGATVDPACLARGHTKFAAAFSKLDAAGGCLVTGDASAIAGVCDGVVATLVANLTTPPPPPGPFCCPLLPDGGACGYVDQASQCALGAGSPGDVCDGATGACIPPPASAGPCCQAPSGPGACNGGPAFLGGSLCTQGGGQFFSSAVCDPQTRTCL